MTQTVVDQTEARREIAAELDTAAGLRESVNAQPDVIAARDAATKAHAAADAAQMEFNRVFDRHYNKENAVIRALLKRWPKLLVLGGTDDYAGQRWVVRCAVTRLPVFKGDRVYISGGDEVYEKVYILADYVTVPPGFAEPVVA